MYVVRQDPLPTSSSSQAPFDVTSGPERRRRTQPSSSTLKKQLGLSHVRHHSPLRGDRPEPHRRARQEGRREPRAPPEQAAGLQRLSPHRGRRRRHELDRLLRHLGAGRRVDPRRVRPGCARRSSRRRSRMRRGSPAARSSCTRRASSSRRNPVEPSEVRREGPHPRAFSSPERLRPKGWAKARGLPTLKATHSTTYRPGQPLIAGIRSRQLGPQQPRHHFRLPPRHRQRPIIDAVHARRAPMIAVTASLQL